MNYLTRKHLSRRQLLRGAGVSLGRTILAVMKAGLVLTVIGRSLDDHTHYAIPAVEVERIEEERYQRMSAAINQMKKDHAAPDPLLQE